MMPQPPREVLIVTPNLTIRENAIHPEKSLPSLSQYGNFADALPPRAVEVTASIAEADLENHDLFVMNYQNAKLDNLLKTFPVSFFNLLVIDEAHHSTSSNYVRISSHFASARTVLVTATPVRADGTKIDAKTVYRYPILHAIQNRFIREPCWLPVPVATMTVDGIVMNAAAIAEKAKQSKEFQNAVQTSEVCQQQVIDAATTTMLGMRNSGKLPQCRCIAAVYDKTAGYALEALWSRLHPDLKVRFIEGDTKDRKEIFKALKADVSSGKQIDVIIHCKVLGEGFDNYRLAVAALFVRHASLSPFSQFVGRCVRRDENDPGRCYVVSHPGLGAKPLWDTYCKETPGAAKVPAAKKEGKGYREFQVADSRLSYDNLLQQIETFGAASERVGWQGQEGAGLGNPNDEPEDMEESEEV
jgi:superfamily II DNA or RNA helicase